MRFTARAESENGVGGWCVGKVMSWLSLVVTVRSPHRIQTYSAEEGIVLIGKIPKNGKFVQICVAIRVTWTSRWYAGFPMKTISQEPGTHRSRNSAKQVGQVSSPLPLLQDTQLLSQHPNLILTLNSHNYQWGYLVRICILSLSPSPSSLVLHESTGEVLGAKIREDHLKPSSFQYLIIASRVFSAAFRAWDQDDMKFIYFSVNDRFPPIRPLETLHNALSFIQLDNFLERILSAHYRPVSSLTPSSGSMSSGIQSETLKSHFYSLKFKYRLTLILIHLFVFF